MSFWSKLMKNKKVEGGVKKTAIESLIGTNTVIEGNMTFSGGMRIDGTVKGNIRAHDDKPSMVVVSSSGRVEGEVSAAHVIVNGTIDGPVTASRLLELQPGAKVHGNVEYKSLEMHTGAVVEGTLHHSGEVKTGLKLASNNG